MKSTPIKFTVHRDGYTTYDGIEVNEYNSDFESPFVPGLGGLQERCYVIYKGLFGKYKIRECIVVAIEYTNCWLWKMDNGWTYFIEDLDKSVFRREDLDKAIKICEEKNRLGKVKVKYLWR